MSTAVYHEMAMRLEHDIVAAEKQLADLRAARTGLQPLLDTHSGATATPVLALAAQPSRRGRGPVVDADVIENGAAAPGAPAAAPKGKKKKPAKRLPPAASGFPRTGDEFWRKLMGKGKHTIPELVAKAAAKLEVAEDAAPLLKNRVNAWLYPKVGTDVTEVGVKGTHKQFQLQQQPAEPAAE